MYHGTEIIRWRQIEKKWSSILLFWFKGVGVVVNSAMQLVGGSIASFK